MKDNSLILKEMNDKLKEVKTYKELENFIQEVSDLWNKGVYAYMAMKRSGYEALDFTPALNPAKVDYILDDGISFRQCRIDNLYRYVKVVE